MQLVKDEQPSRVFRLLILVLSYNEEPYASFMRTQINTWDAIKNDQVQTCYYYGGGEDKYVKVVGENCMRLEINCSDAYEMMHWKFKRALDAVPYHKYDMIFRTNSCSYLDKARLLTVAQNLPKTNCYAGYDNGSYISGAGIFLSPDVCELLRHALTDQPHGAEDVLIGEILAGRCPMIGDRSRVDATVEGVEDLNTYHWRFKTSNDPADRYRDINNMVKLHEKLTDARPRITTESTESL